MAVWTALDFAGFLSSDNLPGFKGQARHGVL